MRPHLIRLTKKGKRSDHCYNNNKYWFYSAFLVWDVLLKALYSVLITTPVTGFNINPALIVHLLYSLGSILAMRYFRGAHMPYHATNNVRILPGTHTPFIEPRTLWSRVKGSVQYATAPPNDPKIKIAVSPNDMPLSLQKMDIIGDIVLYFILGHLHITVVTAIYIFGSIWSNEVSKFSELYGLQDSNKALSMGRTMVGHIIIWAMRVACH